jgi:CHAD domain-containing protein
LRSRLSTVLYWFPLAANNSDEDIEYVHQLRVSVRRADAAIRVFSDLVPKSICRQVRGELRQVRQVAGEARNLDVLCAKFVRCAETLCEETCSKIADAARTRRREAQQPIVALHADLTARGFPDQVDRYLDEIKAKAKKRKGTTFGEQAPRYLQRALRRLFTAAEAELFDDEAIHELRICAKKLRYTMEIVGSVFEPGFRKKLYPRISALQDLMGRVNDHATAKVLFGDWLERADDPHEKAFFRGILMAEEKAHEDICELFRAIWTPKTVTDLRRRFRKSCGLV